MKGLIASLLVLILACLGYMIWDKKHAEARQERAATEAFQANEELRRHEATIAKAIRERAILVGMTIPEIRESWGNPNNVRDVSADLATYGIHYELDYPGTVVQLNAEGKVVRWKQESNSLLVRQ